METQNSQNVQDGFLNTLRRDRINVTIYLVGGVKLTGKIRSFDKFSVVLESGNLEQLIFKHAISTISVPRGSMTHTRDHHTPSVGADRVGADRPPLGDRPVSAERPPLVTREAPREPAPSGGAAPSGD
ncbi:MAG: RNA chaperone Hfq [Acidobacteria bacterium]|nr:RNA chaperone Hfq [Acidobacteriota bacterium]MBI3422938.1 RNA chaperone Hfq [Acidobacteriota bacterium]